MVFLEYEKDTKYVIEIHETEPSSIADGCAIAQSDQFAVGDEFEYLIKVNSVDGNGTVTSYSSVRQARSYSRILQESKQLQEWQEEQDDILMDLLFR